MDIEICMKIYYLTRTRFPDQASFSQRQFLGVHVKLKQASKWNLLPLVP